MKKAYIRFCYWAAGLLLASFATSCGAAKKAAKAQDSEKQTTETTEVTTPAEELKPAPQEADTVRVRPEGDPHIMVLYGVMPADFERFKPEEPQK